MDFGCDKYIGSRLRQFLQLWRMMQSCRRWSLDLTLCVLFMFVGFPPLFILSLVVVILGSWWWQYNPVAPSCLYNWIVAVENWSGERCYRRQLEFARRFWTISISAAGTLSMVSLSHRTSYARTQKRKPQPTTRSVKITHSVPQRHHNRSVRP